MSSILQNILGLLLVYKYLTLFIVAFLSSLGVPLPAGSSFVAAAAFASQGYLNLPLVMIVGAVGNILGDIFMYSIFKKYGIRVLYFLHLKRLAESESLKFVEKVDQKYSAAAIIISRFQDQATTVVNVISGLAQVKFKRFMTLVIIGDILQIIFYSSIGFFFAANWESLYRTVGVASWLIVLLAIIIFILIATRITKRMLK